MFKEKIMISRKEYILARLKNNVYGIIALVLFYIVCSLYAKYLYHESAALNVIIFIVLLAVFLYLTVMNKWAQAFIERNHRIIKRYKEQR